MGPSEAGTRRCLGWLAWVPDMMLEEWAPEGSAWCSNLPSSWGHSVTQAPCKIGEWLWGKEGSHSLRSSFPSLSVLPHAIASSKCPDLTLNSYRPHIAKVEVLLMDCIRTTWALHIRTILSKGTWSWSQTQISSNYRLTSSFLLMVSSTSHHLGLIGSLYLLIFCRRYRQMDLDVQEILPEWEESWGSHSKSCCFFN